MMKSLLFATSVAALMCACTTPPDVSSEAPTPECLPDGSCCKAPIAAQVGETVLTQEALNTAVTIAMNTILTECGEGEIADYMRMGGLEQYRTDILVEFVMAELVQAIAARNGITATPEEIAKERAEYEAYYGISAEQLATVNIVEEGVTAPNFEAIVLMEKVASELVKGEMTVTDEEVQAELAKRKATQTALEEAFKGYRERVATNATTFEALVKEHSEMAEAITLPDDQLEHGLPESVATAVRATAEGALTDTLIEDGAIAIIKVIKRTPATSGDEAATAAELEAVRARILAGEDFAELAEAVSDCPSGVRAGGDLGSFSKGMMVPAFEEVAFTLPIGELSPVFKTDFGYHILKVTARDDAAGTVTASHILMMPEGEPATTEFLLLLKEFPTEVSADALRSELEELRMEEAYTTFMAEQIKAIGVSIPADPKLEASLYETFSFP